MSAAFDLYRSRDTNKKPGDLVAVDAVYAAMPAQPGSAISVASCDHPGMSYYIARSAVYRNTALVICWDEIKALSIDVIVKKTRRVLDHGLDTAP